MFFGGSNKQTVREHLLLYGGLKGVYGARLEREIQHKVSELGLLSKIDAQVHTLSGGERRKLSVGIALLGDSKVLVLVCPM